MAGKGLGFGPLRELTAWVRAQEVLATSWGARGSDVGAPDASAPDASGPDTSGGFTALLVGPPGTGKTMAAETLARELGRDLVRVDLSDVVSKYIGETEKNLARVFEAAEGSGAILFFDEADALLGKRSKVRDAHDRYANLETSFLLQRLESHGGLVILTANQLEAFEPAMVRRLDFVLKLPPPANEKG